VPEGGESGWEGAGNVGEPSGLGERHHFGSQVSDAH
jgi:hypothetical protein